MANPRFTSNPTAQWGNVQPQLELEYDYASQTNDGSQPQQPQYSQHHLAPGQQFMTGPYTPPPNDSYPPGQDQPGVYPDISETSSMDQFRGHHTTHGTYPTSVSQPVFNHQATFYTDQAQRNYSGAPAGPYDVHYASNMGADSSSRPRINTVVSRSQGGDSRGITPPFVSSPNAMHVQFHPQNPGHTHQDIQQPQFLTQHPLYEGQQSNQKRARPVDDDNLRGDASGNEQDGGESQGIPARDKAKPAGACSRCKGLKVKCEFRPGDESCRRCSTGRYECFIPGRKKRRTPPKREVLLGQIRQQASKIDELMAQLAAVQRNQTYRQHSPDSHLSPTADLSSPVLSVSSPEETVPSKPEVQDWLSKARESLQTFGGLIGVGGTGVTKDMLHKEDPEDSSSTASGEYEFALEDSDGEMGLEPEDDARSRTFDVESVSDRGTGSSKKKSTGPGSQKLAILPSEAAPFGLMATLSLKKHRRRMSSTGGADDDDDVGPANPDFFRASPTPDPIVRRHDTEEENRPYPHIIARNIITVDEADKLFKIYFDNMNDSLSLLDPALYAAPQTLLRSPFLFTVICAIASRYYSTRTDLYHRLMHYAQLAAGTALIGGQKSVDMVHGYILLSLYSVPVRRWEDDRSWVYLGLAIRVAIDLNLHHPNTAQPLSELHAREMLNRTRAWLNCFNLDRSTGSQYGKAPVIKNTDYVANHCEAWYTSSVYNMPDFDIHTCAYNAELKVIADFRERIYSDPKHPTGLNKDVDFEKIAMETDDKLARLGDHWFHRLNQTDQSNLQNHFRTSLLRLAYSYSRLVALSFGFQHAFGKNSTDDNPFLKRCYRAASDVINTFLREIAIPTQRFYLRHGPDAQSVFVTFACTFFVKLLQPKYASYLTKDQRLEIRSLVKQVIDVLGSPEIAIDEKHGPKLYSRFLEGLLATPLARVDSQSPPGLDRNASLPHRRKPRAGASGDSERSFDMNVSSNQLSPTANSLSPPPPPAFESVPLPVAPSTEDLFKQQTTVNTNAFSQDALGLNSSELYPQPLPFDEDMLKSMQPDLWQSPMPGFGWMMPMSTDMSQLDQIPMPQNYNFNLKSETAGMMLTPQYYSR